MELSAAIKNRILSVRDNTLRQLQPYQEAARIFTVSFRGKSWNDKIQIKDVPPVFYSEVMADLDFLIKAV